MNENLGVSTTFFADDQIVLVKNKNPEKVKEKLEYYHIKIKKCYRTWKLKVNDDKSETILCKPRYYEFGSIKFRGK